ncbi:sensor histidine kinase [Nocardia thailandica]|uniref:sensor histidine kinase n=1 Tax=Nocardia thailandica TaxID=257275 RepID=UPI0005B8D743|nr:histidine kinase [Nocardia thailandica]
MSRGTVVDAVIAVGVAAALVLTGVTQHTGAAALPAGYALLAASGLALFFRRRAPLTVLAVTGMCALGWQAAGFDVPAVSFLFAVYAAVRAGHRWTTAGASVALLAALPLAVLVSLRDLPAAAAQARGALEIAWLVAAGAAGEALRQAERRADEAERSREETARRRAGEERLHIARELHDSLTHQISVITVQSEAAVHVARRRGEDVPAALLAIRDAGREAARELRATLDALRDDDTAPRPGSARVPDLLDRARAAGLDAALTVTGTPRTLPVAVDRTVFRIVQEALTNAARHARGGAVDVRLAYGPGELVVRVDDDGPAAPAGRDDPRGAHTAATAGAGLLGMRERVHALGGRLHAAPRGDGFRVEAVLPVDPAS